MKFEHTEVFNIEGAARGMRNPKESWNRNDTCTYVRCFNVGLGEMYTEIGEKDLKLMQQLIRAGSEHRKFMRQIFVSVDITAPLYFWKEFDTYKVGTVANSTSTMHKLASTPITKECFEMGDIEEELNTLSNYNVANIKTLWTYLISQLEYLREQFNITKDKRYWKELIRLLPSSWLQKRTVTMNYENLLNICSKGQRRNHKLTEWSIDFMEWAKTLPYANELIFLE